MRNRDVFKMANGGEMYDDFFEGDDDFDLSTFGTPFSLGEDFLKFFFLPPPPPLEGWP